MRIYFFIILVLLLFSVLLFCTGRQLYLWIKLLVSSVKPLPFILVFSLFWLGTIGIFIYGRVPNNLLPHFMQSFSHYALGLFAYMSMIFLLLGFLLFIGRTIHLFSPKNIHEVRLYAGSLAAVLVFVFFLYGSIQGQKISSMNYRVEISKRESELQSLRIAMISDLHLGYMIGEKHVEKMVQKINEQQPDLILMAGDIFDGDMTAIKNPKKIQELFRGLKSTYGIYASLGNHDAGRTYKDMLAFLEKSGVKLLLDDYEIVDNKFIILGRRDSSPIGEHGKDREPLAKIPDKVLPMILLDHQPANIREYGPEIDLILSGHTHRGQLFPFNWITSAIYEVDYGYYRKDIHSPQVIVSSGVGTWGPPLRTSSQNEVVFIEVEFN